MTTENISESETLTHCRICGSSNLTSYLDLSQTPLANSLLTEAELKKGNEKYFPLEVLYCRNCHFSQLSTIVNPEIMFRNYPYRSSVSETFRAHCRESARIFKDIFGFKEGDLIVDIASNDGCMLAEFKKEGFKVLGVDPAENLAEIANNNGIETICAFWNNEIAEQIRNDKSPAKIITATNVFAHVHDIRGFTEAVERLLTDDGIFMVESPHAYQMLKNAEFDTIYHEHLSYLLVFPLKILFESYNMRIVRVDETDIHGGSIRIFVCKKNAPYKEDKSVEEIINKERDSGLLSIEGYEEFKAKVEKIKRDLNNIIQKIMSEGKTIAAYGASAKGSTLLNYCGITSENIMFIADDTPEKQSHYSPGTHIPIVPSSQITDKMPNYLLLLAWNFAAELMKNTRGYEQSGGKYIIPIPEVRIITSEDPENQDTDEEHPSTTASSQSDCC